MITRGAIFVRGKDGNRLTGLNEQRLLRPQTLQFADNRVKALPVTCGLADPAIDNKVRGALGHLGIKIVHQATQCGFLLPALAAQWLPRGARMTGAATVVINPPGNRPGHLRFLSPKPLHRILPATESRMNTESADHRTAMRIVTRSGSRRLCWPRKRREQSFQGPGLKARCFRGCIQEPEGPCSLRWGIEGFRIDTPVLSVLQLLLPSI